MSEEDIEDNELEPNEVPCLGFGENGGMNQGFFIFTGENFVWFQATSVKEACDFAGKIISIEPMY